MKYKILEYEYKYDLQSEVNKHIEGGWKPQGGVVFSYYGLSNRWIQAMVKE